jgi:hypothetical protein
MRNSCINTCLLMFSQYHQLSHYIFWCNIGYHQICQFNNYFVNICIFYLPPPSYISPSYYQPPS